MPTVTKLNSLSELPRVYKNGKRSWTNEDLGILKHLLSQGHTYKKIGRELNRTTAAVQTKASVKGLAKHRGGAVKKELPHSFEALKTTQEVLKSLGYRLAITKLEQ